MPGLMLWRAGRFVDATLDLEQGLGAESALCATLAIAPYGRARTPLRPRLCYCLAAAAVHRLDRNVVLLRESQVKAAHPNLFRVSGGGEREIVV